MVRRPSTVDLIADELRRAIFTGSLQPGSAVREAEVAAQLGVSRGPFREGAQRLVADGLLVPRPGAGLKVVEVGIDELEELYQARFAVESHALRDLAALAPADRSDRLNTVDEAVSELAAAIEAGEARRIGDADLGFHRRLMEVAGNARLTGFADALLVQTRLAALSHPDGYIVRTDVLGDYSTMISQIREGRGEDAVVTLRAHFRQTVDRLSGRLEEPVVTVEGSPEGPTHIFAPLA